VRLGHAWLVMPEKPVHWGFELTTARADSGVGYGTFVPGPGTQNVTAIAPGVGDPTRRYISHDASGIHEGDPGPVEWTLSWHSPSYPAPKVYFFAAGNSANGDSLSSNDFIFTTAESTSYALVDVPASAHGHTWLAVPSPNPGSSRIQLEWTLARSARARLEIADVQGRAVRTLVDGLRAEGRGVAVWDGRTSTGSRAPAGMYFARLRVEGLNAPLTQRLALTH
jgi:flagellar hook capping protein FlgD